MSIDEKIVDYLERAKQITKDNFQNPYVISVPIIMEIAKMIQLEEIHEGDQLVTSDKGYENAFDAMMGVEQFPESVEVKK